MKCKFKVAKIPLRYSLVKLLAVGSARAMISIPFGETVMDFNRFSQARIDNRDVEHLIGLSQGLMADGKINYAEAKVLMSWLVQRDSSRENPTISSLLQTVGGMLSGGELSQKDSMELLSVLSSISGEVSEVGELAKTSTLPLCNPAPDIVFAGKCFLFSGKFLFGNRHECQNVTKLAGGKCISRVVKTLDYLVIGSYATESWKHESFGCKIIKAADYRDSGCSLSIVSEAHWAESGGFERSYAIDKIEAR